jgi:hypothetical protein
MVLLDGALARVRVQAVLAFAATVEGVHLRAETVTGPADTSERVVGTAEPFREAVIVAVWSAVRAPAVAVKVAEVALAGTLTEAGTVNTVEALLESVTTEVLVADFERVTVQVALALEARVAGAH